MMHSFSEKLRQGQIVERALDEHFGERYIVQQVTRIEQRHGIDRLFTDRESGERRRVEYKADYRAIETGNVFIETVSQDSSNVRGWAYTSRADWLIYALPQRHRYLLVLLDDLRRMLPEWIGAYRRGVAKNKTYGTHGVLVPLATFEKLAHYQGHYGGPHAHHQN